MTGENTPERGFLIDGSLYEVPAFGTFTMDEAVIFYEYCGFPYEDVSAIDPEAKDDEREAQLAEIERKLGFPGVMGALAHIAYRRARPKEKEQTVKKLIGATSRLELLSGLVTEDDERPPASGSTNEPDESSPSDKSGSTGSSGQGSSPVSDGQGVDPQPTGDSRSETSPTSPRLASVT